MKPLEALADKLRVGGAAGRALALLFGFAVIFLFLPRPKDDPVIAEEHTDGIVQMNPEGAAATEAKSWIATVQLQDGRKLRIMFPAPQPHTGDQVPLRVVTYQSGEKRYFLDTESWQTHAR
jgi:hypothetical protein